MILFVFHHHAWFCCIRFAACFGLVSFSAPFLLLAFDSSVIVIAGRRADVARLAIVAARAAAGCACVETAVLTVECVGFGQQTTQTL